MQVSAVLAWVVTALAALALLRGFSGQAWSDRMAAVAWLMLPGVIFTSGWDPMPFEFSAVRVFLLVALVLVVWDRALNNRLDWAGVKGRWLGASGWSEVPGSASSRAVRGLARFRRLTGWMLAPLAAMLMARAVALSPLETEPKNWLLPLFLEDGRFALVLAWAFALGRMKVRPPFILWASAWTALHVASLASLPEARHFLDLSHTFLAEGLIYGLGAWGLNQLFPKYAPVVWALVIAHALRLWLI